MCSVSYELPQELAQVLSATIICAKEMQFVLAYDAQFLYSFPLSPGSVKVLLQKFPMAGIKAILPLARSFFAIIMEGSLICLFEVDVVNKKTQLLTLSLQIKYSSFFLREVVNNMIELQIFHTKNQFQCYQFTSNKKVGKLGFTINNQHKIQSIVNRNLHGTKSFFNPQESYFYVLKNFSDTVFTVQQIANIQKQYVKLKRTCVLQYIGLKVGGNGEEFVTVESDFVVYSTLRPSVQHSIKTFSEDGFLFNQRFSQLHKGAAKINPQYRVSSHGELLLIERIGYEACVYQIQRQNSFMVSMERDYSHWAWAAGKKLVGISFDRKKLKVVQIDINEFNMKGSLRFIEKQSHGQSSERRAHSKRDFQVNRAPQADRAPQFNKAPQTDRAPQIDKAPHSALSIEEKTNVKYVQAKKESKEVKVDDKMSVAAQPTDKKEGTWPGKIIQKGKVSVRKTLPKAKEMDPIAHQGTERPPEEHRQVIAAAVTCPSLPVLASSLKCFNGAELHFSEEESQEPNNKIHTNLLQKIEALDYVSKGPECLSLFNTRIDRERIFNSPRSQDHQKFHWPEFKVQKGEALSITEQKGKKFIEESDPYIFKGFAEPYQAKLFANLPAYLPSHYLQQTQVSSGNPLIEATLTKSPLFDEPLIDLQQVNPHANKHANPLANTVANTVANPPLSKLPVNLQKTVICMQPLIETTRLPLPLPTNTSVTHPPSTCTAKSLDILSTDHPQVSPLQLNIFSDQTSTSTHPSKPKVFQINIPPQTSCPPLQSTNSFEPSQPNPPVDTFRNQNKPSSPMGTAPLRAPVSFQNAPSKSQYCSQQIIESKRRIEQHCLQFNTEVKALFHETTHKLTAVLEQMTTNALRPALPAALPLAAAQIRAKSLAKLKGCLVQALTSSLSAFFKETMAQSGQVYKKSLQFYTTLAKQKIFGLNLQIEQQEQCRRDMASIDSMLRVALHNIITEGESSNACFLSQWSRLAGQTNSSIIQLAQFYNDIEGAFQKKNSVLETIGQDLRAIKQLFEEQRKRRQERKERKEANTIKVKQSDKERKLNSLKSKVAKLEGPSNGQEKEGSSKRR